MTMRQDRPRCFQDIILRLQSYWAAQGCAIMQPYDMEVGAGTFHPATTVRGLGRPLMCSRRGAPPMVAMAKILIAYNIIISIKC